MFRAVVRTLTEDGRDALSPGVMLWRDHNVDIKNRSTLIVESNQKAVARIQGQISGTYDAGTHQLNTPNSGMSNVFSRLGYGGNVPWVAEVIFASTTRFEAKSVGISLSSELIPLQYQVAYYFQILDVVKLIQAVQLNGYTYTSNDLANDMAPLIDQSISQTLTSISIKEIYANLHKITEAATAILKQNLDEIGIELLMSRVIRIEPEDETLRRIIQLNGLGLDTQTALRSRLAEIMANRSDPAATNMLLGVPYYPTNILLSGTGFLDSLGQTQETVPDSSIEKRNTQKRISNKE